MMELTLSCDHRILYGADAAEFLARIREPSRTRSASRSSSARHRCRACESSVDARLRSSAGASTTCASAR